MPCVKEGRLGLGISLETVERRDEENFVESLFDKLWLKLLTRAELVKLVEREYARGRLSAKELRRIKEATYTSLR